MQQKDITIYKTALVSARLQHQNEHQCKCNLCSVQVNFTFYESQILHRKRHNSSFVSRIHVKRWRTAFVSSQPAHCCPSPTEPSKPFLLHQNLPIAVPPLRKPKSLPLRPQADLPHCPTLFFYPSNSSFKNFSSIKRNYCFNVTLLSCPVSLSKKLIQECVTSRLYYCNSFLSNWSNKSLRLSSWSRMLRNVYWQELGKEILFLPY